MNPSSFVEHVWGMMTRRLAVACQALGWCWSWVSPGAAVPTLAKGCKAR